MALRDLSIYLALCPFLHWENLVCDRRDICSRLMKREQCDDASQRLRISNAGNLALV